LTSWTRADRNPGLGAADREEHLVVTLLPDGTERADEFALVAEATGRYTGPPCVRRRLAITPAGGYLSGVVWGPGQPELVFLHDREESARVWDAVALILAMDLGRTTVAIDLPGHGESSPRRDGRYEPARITPAVAEAIHWFAPRARLVAGIGLGALTALALRRRHPGLVPGIALVNTLPGRPAVGPAGPAGPVGAVGSGGPTCDELAQLPGPVTLIRGTGTGPVAAGDLAELRRQAPQLGVVTVTGTGPEALAAALDSLLGISLSPAGRPAVSSWPG
jgi:pimeloyl-ACP methyl ester carboxylesterase